ncbi:HDIG domain-containing metalloprotein [Anoxynatronum sibiricum]|uniref:HDIG domain-containing metalloprotein n=1 Tax=Anoxynatronum sibiricum TaxID=210623 RepID=A0ABU9VRG7_9CLOT
MTLIDGWKKRKKGTPAESGRLEMKRIAGYVLMCLLFFLVLFFTLLASLQPPKYDLRVGQAAPEEVLSPKLIVDQHRTQQLRSEAMSRVEPVYRLDQGIYPEVKRDIDSLFDLVFEVREMEEVTPEEIVAELQDNMLGITGYQLLVLAETPVERLQNLQNYLYEIIAQRMNQGIKVADLQWEKGQIREYVGTLTEFEENLRETAVTIINSTIRPNEFLNVEATENARQEAEESIEPVVIRRGEAILRQGDRVTADRLALMRELGLVEGEYQPNYLLYAGITLVVLLVMLLFVGYLWQFHPVLLHQLDKLLLIVLIITLISLMTRPIFILSPYLIPTAAGAMLLSLLVDPRLALMANTMITLLVGLSTGNNVLMIMMGLVGGTAGVLSMMNTQQRGNIFISGVIIGAANVVMVAVFRLVGMHESVRLWMDLIYAFLNGILCAVLTIGSLPFWEYTFSILTPLKLIELSNPSHPLLKRLLMEAPGTYHHSIVVGNLAESAVNAVGGDGLLVRTGAFYHDIGKLKRPFFFKENQYMMENPHDKLAPSLSALIITGHVKEGLEIAVKHRLPVKIRAFIEEHHGTTLAAYFFHKAKSASSEPEKIDEHMYRYNGPIPQSRETAILMLADSVEAAVRSMENPTRDRIEQMVQKIIQGKLDDGQLEDSQLTLTELKEVRKTFTRILAGILHERIQYPEMDLKELKGKSP